MSTYQTTSQADVLIVARLRESLPGLRAVYRYGSAGSCYERPDSDIDLAVLLDMPLDFRLQNQLATELAQLTGREIDLNDMGRLPVTLRVQIVTQGVRLFATHHGAAEEYDSRTLSDYAYLNEARRGIMEDVRSRGNIYG
jgi:predicted nucleotidyltransferase